LTRGKVYAIIKEALNNKVPMSEDNKHSVRATEEDANNKENNLSSTLQDLSKSKKGLGNIKKYLQDDKVASAVSKLNEVSEKLEEFKRAFAAENPEIANAIDEETNYFSKKLEKTIGTSKISINDKGSYSREF
jgi:uncharacterized protein with gpF-like domain